MKVLRKQEQKTKSVRRGAIAVLIAVCLPAMLILGAFTVNVAYMQLVRTELRVATDAGARAGGRMLSLTQNIDAARAKAVEAAGRNRVGTDPLVVDAADVVFGKSTRSGTGRFTFAAVDNPDEVNSVQLQGSRTSASSGGAVPLMFSAIPGHDSFQPVKTAVSTQIDRDIALVLDRSGSMMRNAAGKKIGWRGSGRPAPANSRWRNLATAVDAFLAELESTPQTEQVSLATFSTSATLDINLSQNYGQVRSRLAKLSEAYQGGWTAIGMGMQDGMNALLNPATARPFAVKTIVVMTDGVHNLGIDPDDVAKLVHDNHGAIVHTVTFGAAADIAQMKLAAQKGGGQHWHAADAASLTAAFREIARNLPTLLTN